MWDELLREIAIIKWVVICIAVSLWGFTAYLFLKELPKWWRSFDKKKEKKKPFTLEQMNKDLDNATRPRSNPKTSAWMWDK